VKKYKNKEWLFREYVEKERLPWEIAEECSVSRTTISRWLSRYRIPKRSIGEETRIGWSRTGWVEREK